MLENWEIRKWKSEKIRNSWNYKELKKRNVGQMVSHEVAFHSTEAIYKKSLAYYHDHKGWTHRIFERCLYGKCSYFVTIQQNLLSKELFSVNYTCSKFNI